MMLLYLVFRNEKRPQLANKKAITHNYLFILCHLTLWGLFLQEDQGKRDKQVMAFTTFSQQKQEPELKC